MTGNLKIYEERAKYSLKRLNDLRDHLSKSSELANFPVLTIFAVGSYARLEASEYSDIDMFFICDEKKDNIVEPRTSELRLFGKVIDTIDNMKFPKFSNDCEYLVLLHTDEIIKNIGSPIDDHKNFFTARMLLLLEAHCLYEEKTYKEIIAKIISSYFKDYPDHEQTFQPTFLLNDICRYWKTILLNYENKRDIAEEPKEQKIKHRVRNFKLKFSRMTTCFATISALGSYKVPLKEEQLAELTMFTPSDRIRKIISFVPEAKAEVNEVLTRYAWFLEKTGLPTEQLEDYFSDKKKRSEMFQIANEYGDAMFKLLRAVDSAVSKETGGLLRYLVI